MSEIVFAQLLQVGFHRAWVKQYPCQVGSSLDDVCHLAAAFRLCVWVVYHNPCVYNKRISFYSVELEVRMSAPTYKELIQLLNEAESVTSSHHSVLSIAELLTMNFSHLYPHIEIGRPGRFLETVRRINSPVRSYTWKGTTSKQSYLRRLWSPKIRNTKSQYEGMPPIEHVCHSSHNFF